MAEPVRLLVLSKDNTLFSGGGAVQGDARLRHIRYAETLRNLYGAASDIRIITYTRSASGHRRDEPAPGLRLYGTASAHRALYLADAARLIPAVMADGWRPTAVTVQTPWEEGVLGALTARLTGAAFLPQLHFDLLSPDWAREHLLNPWRRFVASWVLKRATRVRVVSQPLKLRISQALQIKPDRIDVIPVGVNFMPSFLSPAQAKQRLDGRFEGHPLVLFVGRLTAQKNLMLWLDVAADILLERPDVRFALVGDGEEDAALQQVIDARGLGDKIRLMGPAGHESLPDIYAAADLFLLTSHYEGFGRVVLEAGFAGVPSIATRCVGPEDIIENGRSGVLVERGDRAGLVGAALTLLDDEPSRAAMGRAAFDKAEAQFGLSSLAGRLSHHWAGA